jgi:type IV secretory pathway VirJ component
VKRLLAALLFAATAVHANAPDVGCAARTGVTDLPLIEFPATRTDSKQHSFAIMFTGDGGWRRIDIQVTNPLRENGIPVVGFLTPAFYGTTRGADESACAL